ncbi:Gfo/Idh/MocA family oxidoreductase [Candidatus Methylomirabilis sp.]|uniref:Gfo/Idh/MocA family oxidoreductase n=1 Tax=Candidatus Methylomirabilis tolerans TaxID=3123416 RepID=A0AAJ1AFM8_9BACT|nr:Gfo/Idh/MocA family oxidoreductase [Candidatus Methylomirabilis sp.]
MIRVGIVGCGRMGENHCRIVRELNGVSIVGVVDPNPDRARAIAANYSIEQAASRLEELLERTRVDAVHILTPPTTHAPLACTALHAGCHVLVEKPMALTAKEAEQMLDAATQHDRILTVGHNHLFEPVVREAHARVVAGRLGRLVGLDVFHGCLPGSPPWVADLPSGPWINDMSHPLYLSQLFLGEPLAIRAVGHPHASRQKVREVRVATQHAEGVSTLTLSTDTAPFQHRLTLFGTERTLEVDLINEILVETRPFSGHRWLRKGRAVLDVSTQLLLGAGRNACQVLTGRARGWPGLRSLIQAFYAAIETGGPSPVPPIQGVRVVTHLEEISRQLLIMPDTARPGAKPAHDAGK